MTVSAVGLCISIDGLNDQQVRCFPSVGAKQVKKFRLLECFALVVVQSDASFLMTSSSIVVVQKILAFSRLNSSKK